MTWIIARGAGLRVWCHLYSLETGLTVWVGAADVGGVQSDKQFIMQVLGEPPLNYPSRTSPI